MGDVIAWMKAGDVEIVVIERELWQRAWQQACDKFMATAQSEPEAEDAMVFIRVAEQILGDAFQLIQFEAEPPEGKPT